MTTTTAPRWTTIRISTPGGQSVDAFLTEDEELADQCYLGLIKRWFGETDRVERTATLIGPDGETIVSVTVPAKG